VDRRQGRWLATTAALVALALLAAAYLRFGWTRMDHACTTDVVWPAHAASVAFDWSWWPPGFACRYDDGTVLTRLWWWAVRSPARPGA
jgi:hypothetical protein